jgi:caffeoyl-CoA O-methyltransferase
MTDELLAPTLPAYLDGLVPERNAEMRAMEQYAKETDFPIIGPAAGYFCYLMARAIGARNIFELGSGYGYSTAWFARAVAENGGGTVHHVVWDDDLSQRARRHLSALGLDGIVKYHVGEAVETLKAQKETFDLMFNDIDKSGYPASIPVVYERLRPGGVLIIDNMLWHARIFDNSDQSDATNGVRETTRLLTRDDRWISSLVPIRDGMILSIKR